MNKKEATVRVLQYRALRALAESSQEFRLYGIGEALLKLLQLLSYSYAVFWGRRKFYG
jgi:hypothetical protein